MITALFAAIIVAFVVLAGECVLWLLFSKRYQGFHLPSSGDQSAIRIGSRVEILAIAVVHAAILAAVVGFFTFLIW